MNQQRNQHFYLRLGTALWILTAIFAFLPSWPYLYYRLSPQASSQLATTIANTAMSPLSKGDQGGLKPTPSPSPNQPVPGTSTGEPITKNSELPSIDPTLPKKNGIIIDKIGVRGEIHEGQDWESILRKGIWRVPNFATPADLADSPQGVPTQPAPIILAAHRWGYLDWSSAFRKLNSFYNLPKLAVGDKIKIVWEQREYEYEVYSVSTGTEIPEYNANLILYTCQLWNSPVRFFVMANRVN
jgi:sortase (surface protein transpeptidase)